MLSESAVLSNFSQFNRDSKWLSGSESR